MKHTLQSLSHLWTQVRKKLDYYLSYLPYCHPYVIAHGITNVITVLVILLVIILIPISLPTLAVLFIIYYIYDQRNLKKTKQTNKQLRLQRKQHFREVAPYNWKYYINLPIDRPSYRQFGGARTNLGISYMFVLANQQITIPESFYGNHRYYYLVDVDFTPNQIMYRGKPKELLTSALLTFVQADDFNNSFNIEVRGINSEYIHSLKLYFELTSVQKRRLHLF